ncbi:MAG: hypothetical protein K1X28_10375 [Parachlamydiales bacterium]|nr:hypothetical protein [Parachlamydiales bacterium]
MRSFFLVLLVCAAFAVEDKLYLEMDQVSIENNRILVMIENQWTQTNVLYSDTGGVYIFAAKWYGVWTCACCSTINPPHRLICWRCAK